MTPNEVIKKNGITKIGHLAALLNSLPGSKYYQRGENGIRSFLSQTNKGNRKVPKDLFESIIACLLNVNQTSNESILRKELKEAFDYAFQKRKGVLKNDSQDVVFPQYTDYDLFLEWHQKAKTITVITAEPAEVKRTEISYQLMHEMLKHLGVVEDKKEPVSYTFYIAEGGESWRTPYAFWKGLYDYARHLRIENIEERFTLLNEDVLKVYCVPDYEVDICHTIINAEQSRQAVSFISFYKEVAFHKEEMHVIRGERKSLDRVLGRLKKLRSDYKVECRFRDWYEYEGIDLFVKRTSTHNTVAF